MMLNPTDALSLWLAGGGLVGSCLRVVLESTQKTLSRKSLVDVAVGGLVGLLYPLYPVLSFPDGATTLQKAALVAVVAYFSGDFIQSLVGRVQQAKQALTGNGKGTP